MHFFHEYVICKINKLKVETQIWIKKITQINQNLVATENVKRIRKSLFYWKGEMNRECLVVEDIERRGMRKMEFMGSGQNGNVNREEK